MKASACRQPGLHMEINRGGAGRFAHKCNIVGLATKRAGIGFYPLKRHPAYRMQMVYANDTLCKPLLDYSQGCRKWGGSDPTGFGRSVYPISTRGAHSPHPVLRAPRIFRPCDGPADCNMDICKHLQKKKCICIYSTRQPQNRHFWQIKFRSSFLKNSTAVSFSEKIPTRKVEGYERRSYVSAPFISCSH